MTNELANLGPNDRGIIRDTRKSLLSQWREQAAALKKAAPRGKLGEQVSLLWGEVAIFDDWVQSLGGEKNAEFFICAKVYKRDTLDKIATDCATHPGLLWAFMTETEERFKHYLRAQEGVADQLVSAIPGIVDGEPRVVRDASGNIEYDSHGKPVVIESDLARDKVRGEYYLKAAGKLHHQRFGDSGTKVGINIAGDATVVLDHDQTLLEAARGIAFLLAAAERAQDDSAQSMPALDVVAEEVKPEAPSVPPSVPPEDYL